MVWGSFNEILGCRVFLVLAVISDFFWNESFSHALVTPGFALGVHLLDSLRRQYFQVDFRDWHNVGEAIRTFGWSNIVAIRIQFTFLTTFCSFVPTCLPRAGPMHSSKMWKLYVEKFRSPGPSIGDTPEALQRNACLRPPNASNPGAQSHFRGTKHSGPLLGAARPLLQRRGNMKP